MTLTWVDLKNRRELIEGDARRRHMALLDILIKRREHLLDSPEQHLLQAVNRLFPSSSGIIELSFELISDALALIEPSWHGARIEGDGIRVLAADMADQFASEVAERRSAHKGLLGIFPTHASIGSQLTEPQLFAVHTSAAGEPEVLLWAHSEWVAIKEATERDLPLKLDIATADGDVETVERDDLLQQLENSFRILSRDVLWPTFFAEQGGKERVSLVLIHASSWRVAGVWAMHSSRRPESSLPPGGPPAVGSLLVPMAKPPIDAFNDLVGAVMDHAHTHAERLNLVRLCRKARGAPPLLEEEWDGIDHDIDLFVYNGIAIDDVVAQSQAVFLVARSSLLRGEEFLVPTRLTQLWGNDLPGESAVTGLCRLTFIARTLMTRSPWTAQLAVAQAGFLAEDVGRGTGRERAAAELYRRRADWTEKLGVLQAQASGVDKELIAAMTDCYRAIAAFAMLDNADRERAASFIVLTNVWDEPNGLRRPPHDEGAEADSLIEEASQRARRVLACE